MKRKRSTKDADDSNNDRPARDLPAFNPPPEPTKEDYYVPGTFAKYQKALVNHKLKYHKAVPDPGFDDGRGPIKPGILKANTDRGREVAAYRLERARIAKREYDMEFRVFKEQQRKLPQDLKLSEDDLRRVRNVFTLSPEQTKILADAGPEEYRPRSPDLSDEHWARLELIRADVSAMLPRGYEARVNEYLQHKRDEADRAERLETEARNHELWLRRVKAGHFSRE